MQLIREEIREYYWNFLVNRDLLELRNIALVADLIIQSARGGLRAAACIQSGPS